jgi:hypothetical protein
MGGPRRFQSGEEDYTGHISLTGRIIARLRQRPSCARCRSLRMGVPPGPRAMRIAGLINGVLPKSQTQWSYNVAMQTPDPVLV